MREEPLSKFTGTAYWYAPYKGPVFRFGRLSFSLRTVYCTQAYFLSLSLLSFIIIFLSGVCFPSLASQPASPSLRCNHCRVLVSRTREVQAFLRFIMGTLTGTGLGARPTAQLMISLEICACNTDVDVHCQHITRGRPWPGPNPGGMVAVAIDITLATCPVAPAPCPAPDPHSNSDTSLPPHATIDTTAAGASCRF